MGGGCQRKDSWRGSLRDRGSKGLVWSWLYKREPMKVGVQYWEEVVPRGWSLSLGLGWGSPRAVAVTLTVSGGGGGFGGVLF